MTGALPDATGDPLVLAIAASLLEQGRIIDGVSRLITALAIVAAPVVGTVVSPAAMIPLMVVVGLGLLQSWLAVRVGFDAALFGRLATGAEVSTGTFDGAMIGLGLLPRAKAGRTWAMRVGGARRLLLLQGMVMVAQAAGCIGGTFLIMGLWR